MSKTYSKFTMIGCLGRDPELKFVGANKTGMAVFPMVHSYSRKAGDKWEEEKLWIEVVAWGKLAEELVEKAFKGTKVFVDGEFRHEKYVTREGHPSVKIKLNLQAYEILSESDTSSSPPPAPVTPPPPPPRQQQITPTDDIPF